MASKGAVKASPEAPSEDDKKQVGIRLTADGRRLREALAKKLGIDKTAVVEVALRALAKQEGVQ